jgi:hypothetical protein
VLATNATGGASAGSLPSPRRRWMICVHVIVQVSGVGAVAGPRRCFWWFGRMACSVVRRTTSARCEPRGPQSDSQFGDVGAMPAVNELPSERAVNPPRDRVHAQCRRGRSAVLQPSVSFAARGSGETTTRMKALFTCTSFRCQDRRVYKGVQGSRWMFANSNP